jgi:hypothetical protein
MYTTQFEIRQMHINDVMQYFHSMREAARELGIPKSTFWDMVNRRETVLAYVDPITKKPVKLLPRESEVSTSTVESVSVGSGDQVLTALQKENDDLKIKCSKLSSELNHAKKDRLITDEIRQFIFGLNAQPIKPASWLTPQNIEHTSLDYIGVPTLMLSDIHFGETVYPSQVFHVNEYDIETAKSRLREIGVRTIDLLSNHLYSPQGHPGIVVNLGGDLVSGDIHEELSISNEMPTLPCVLDLVNELAGMLTQFQKQFGNVMVFCVPGNHARTTKKIQAKNMAYTNYDWLIGCLLENHFKNNPKINFFVTDQSDIQYKIYDHRYRLTHGAQFRGGQGFLGALGPIARGDKKKRVASSSYGLEYDTLLMGHFHQLWMSEKIIVNGAVVGFNEYAIQNNFEYEVPKQALFVTHPQYGITFTMPVFCEEPNKELGNTDQNVWVQWHEK